MTRFRGIRTAAVLSLIMLAGCARGTADGPVAGSPGGGPTGTVPSATAPSDPAASAERAAGGPVLQVRQTGGFVTPSMLLARLPLISVYADGRVVTAAPQTAEYPGPAMTVLQEHRLDPAAVRALVEKAVAAGVRSGADLGRPNVADAPSTRFTVVSGQTRQAVEVVALSEARGDDPRLTPAQNAARAKLAALLRELTDLPSTLGPPQLYVPATVAAIARPYTADGDPAVSSPPATPWPGPSLPGEILTEGTTMGCVAVSGDDAVTLLAAVRKAKATTPWTSAGRKWTVSFRPMLPEETGCADLKAVR